MEFFDYFTRLFGMDPTQLPVYLRVMTFIVPVAIVVYVICLVVRIVRKSVKAIRHVRLGVRTKEDTSLSADSVRAIAVGALAQSAGFNSWKDFANSYILGRTLWNGECNMSVLAQDLLTKAESPWVRYAWKSQLK